MCAAITLRHHAILSLSSSSATLVCQSSPYVRAGLFWCGARCTFPHDDDEMARLFSCQRKHGGEPTRGEARLASSQCADSSAVQCGGEDGHLSVCQCMRKYSPSHPLPRSSSFSLPSSWPFINLCAFFIALASYFLISVRFSAAHLRRGVSEEYLWWKHAECLRSESVCLWSGVTVSSSIYWHFNMSPKLWLLDCAVYQKSWCLGGWELWFDWGWPTGSVPFFY